MQVGVSPSASLVESLDPFSGKFQRVTCECKNKRSKMGVSGLVVVVAVVVSAGVVSIFAFVVVAVAVVLLGLTEVPVQLW